MDLILEPREKKRSSFKFFINSPVVKDLLRDLEEILEMDFTVADTHGNILFPPRFEEKFTSDILNDYHNFVRQELLGNDFLEPCLIFKSCPQEDFCFVISRIKSPKIEKHLGYLIGGPFIPEGGEDLPRMEGTRTYNFFQAVKDPGFEIKILTKNFHKIISRLVDSYSRILDNVHRENIQSQKNVEKLASLYQINLSLNRTFELQKILQMVLGTATDLLNAAEGLILMVDEDRENLDVFVSRGFKPLLIENIQIRYGEGLLGGVARDAKPVISPGNNSTGEDPLGKGRRMGGSITVPIIAGEESLGVIHISNKRDEEEFSGDDLELMEVLAASASNAIQNAGLYDKLESKIDQLSALFDLGQVIVSSLNRRDVLQKIMDNAIELLQAKAGSLMIYNPELEAMEIEVAVGLPEQVLKETLVKLGEGIAGKVAVSRKPLLLKKGVKHRESKSQGSGSLLPSALCVPMEFRNTIIGVLNVKEKESGGNFTESDKQLLTMLAGQAAVAVVNAQLHKSLKSLFVNSIKALANAIEARDVYTRGHSERVTEYSVKLAGYLEMSEEEVEKIRYAALLHDIGKINIKEEILNKPGRLTREEYEIICEHPSYGAKIMSPVKEFQEILPYMYHHHERFGSGGYPEGVMGNEIPFPARIIAVADAFDAMTSDRPYRDALSMETAYQEINKNCGTQFDPKVVEAFNNIYEKERDWIKAIIDSSNLERVREEYGAE